MMSLSVCVVCRFVRLLGGNVSVREFASIPLLSEMMTSTTATSVMVILCLQKKKKLGDHNIGPADVLFASVSGWWILKKFGLPRSRFGQFLGLYGLSDENKLYPMPCLLWRKSVKVETKTAVVRLLRKGDNI